MKRFYNFSEFELENMCSHKYSIYAQIMPTLEAEERMKLIEACSFSDFKDDSRKKIMRGLKKLAHKFNEKRKLTLSEAFEAIGGRSE